MTPQNSKPMIFPALINPEAHGLGHENVAVLLPGLLWVTFVTWPIFTKPFGAISAQVWNSLLANLQTNFEAPYYGGRVWA